MKKLVTTLALASCAAGTVHAGNEDDERAVFDTIDRFFSAMTERDAATMATLMTEDGIIYGYRESAEGLEIVRPTHAAYLASLAAGTGRPVERYWNPRLMIEGRIATLWTDYDFHLDGAFSHCGLNNFSLLRTDTGWVITGVVFSILHDGCGAPPPEAAAD